MASPLDVLYQDPPEILHRATPIPRDSAMEWMRASDAGPWGSTAEFQEELGRYMQPSGAHAVVNYPEVRRSMAETYASIGQEDYDNPLYEQAMAWQEDAAREAVGRRFQGPKGGDMPVKKGSPPAPVYLSGDPSSPGGEGGYFPARLEPIRLDPEQAIAILKSLGFTLDMGDD